MTEIVKNIVQKSELDEITYEFLDKINNMNYSEKSIEKVGDFFIEKYQKNKECLDSLIKLWSDKIYIEENIYSYCLLADYLITKTSLDMPEIKDLFFKYFKKTFPIISRTLNQKIYKHLAEFLDKFYENNIYEKDETEDLKSAMLIFSDPLANKSDNQNEVILGYINDKNNQLFTDETLFKFCNYLEKYQSDPNDNNAFNNLTESFREITYKECQKIEENIKNIEEINKIKEDLKKYHQNF